MLDETTEEDTAVVAAAEVDTAEVDTAEVAAAEVETEAVLAVALDDEAVCAGAQSKPILWIPTSQPLSLPYEGIWMLTDLAPPHWSF